MLLKLNNYSQLETIFLQYRYKKSKTHCILLSVVGSDGFEPPKAQPAELQSAPFVHSGNCPKNIFEPLVGFKPTTYSLQVSCSITELKRHISFTIFKSSISYIVETAAKIDLFFNKQKKVSKKIISSTLLISFLPINYT